MKKSLTIISAAAAFMVFTSGCGSFCRWKNTPSEAEVASLREKATIDLRSDDLLTVKQALNVFRLYGEINDIRLIVPLLDHPDMRVHAAACTALMTLADIPGKDYSPEGKTKDEVSREMREELTRKGYLK